MPVHLSSTFMFSQRVFGILAMPVQSIASARLTGWINSLKSEISVSLRLGSFSALAAMLLISAYDYLLSGTLTDLSVISLALIPFGVFRAMNTFLGNFLLVRGLGHFRTRILLLSVVLYLFVLGVLTSQRFHIDPISSLISGLLTAECLVFFGMLKFGRALR